VTECISEEMQFYLLYPMVVADIDGGESTLLSHFYTPTSSFGTTKIDSTVFFDFLISKHIFASLFCLNFKNEHNFHIPNFVFYKDIFHNSNIFSTKAKNLK
jgi:hypothetical protein